MFSPVNFSAVVLNWMNSDRALLRFFMRKSEMNLE
jgi:hypothetical protein